MAVLELRTIISLFLIFVFCNLDRKFMLNGLQIQYYDKDKLKGTINIAGSKTKKLNRNEADNKEFPFMIGNI